MRGMKIARDTDPSAGVPNKKPKPRHARWSEGEAVRLVKAAWRHGYHGLACIIAVAWDTQFSPIDVRTLAARHCAAEGDRLLFDRHEEVRTKTGRPAIGALSRISALHVTEETAPGDGTTTDAETLAHLKRSSAPVISTSLRWGWSGSATARP